MKNQTCCVIGYPVSHSLSPLIHNSLYEIYGIDCTYTIREVKPGELKKFVEEIPQISLRGFNITMPYKKEIIPYLSEDPPTGSVNTVAVRDGMLIGTSTDEAGFLKSLDEEGFSYKNKKIVFIGAGAVTGMLAADAASNGAKKITLLNRTVANALAIAEKTGAQADAFDSKKTYPCIEECDLLVNTTPLGMNGCPGFESFGFIENLRPEALVCDLIYNPFDTKLLLKASRQGNPTLGGISMLIWQAFYAFDFFFGIMPTEQDKSVVLQEIEGRQVPDPLIEL
jgi:shikimate dehydrogenase